MLHQCFSIPFNFLSVKTINSFAGSSEVRRQIGLSVISDQDDTTLGHRNLEICIMVGTENAHMRTDAAADTMD